jgi:hypothetical protein
METARQSSHPAYTLRREPAHALPWSDDLLSQFGLRMASHGMSISRTQMQASPGYALEQLAHARALDDDLLQLLVVRMFRLFESHQSGVPLASH